MNEVHFLLDTIVKIDLEPPVDVTETHHSNWTIFHFPSHAADLRVVFDFETIGLNSLYNLQEHMIHQSTNYLDSQFKFNYH